ncbi:MAG TPA: NADH-quinone oxidoreductase subunit F [Clostridiales bacterium]|nr:NADH-quinone oxidoreductase subunit F [Clostridiales bacterium]
MRILVGQGSCGIASGAKKTAAAFAEQIRAAEMDVPVDVTGCIGLCYLEPIVDIYDDNGEMTRYTKVTPDTAKLIFDAHVVGGTPYTPAMIPADGQAFLDKQTRVVMKNCGIINPERIEDYIASGGYRALSKAIRNMTADEICDVVLGSDLRGRGGGGFPTGKKWVQVKRQSEPVKYVVCNADEGDPGAFMDRSILEADPHSVLEGMIIAAKAIDARKGYIYARTEYPLAITRLQIAITQAKERGLLGDDILGSGFDFDIEIYQGAGAFVCGEETALMRSIEGRRGMPRPRPPFPAHKGLWEKPTILNNVETLCNVPQIMLHGGDWYASVGTATSKGTKVFAMSGDVNNIGLVEVPMGTPLRTLIYDIGGGIPKKRKFKGVQLGGPSGGCIPEHLLDTPVDYEEIAKVGAIMGSGGVIVMDENTCMVDIARFFMEFTQDESCGKCTPCRVGTRRILEILTRICEGKGKPEDIDTLRYLCDQINENSLCGLGKGAPNPVKSTLEHFLDEYEAHIYEKRCPAKVCKSLIRFEIIDGPCTGCGLCARNCPVNAISGERRQTHVIDPDICIKCGICEQLCPYDAIEIK